MARVAVIGVGGWGRNHARVMHELGALAAVCDMDGSRAKEVGERYGARHYASLDEMLSLEKEKELDACLVCTPTKTHFQVARKVMESGLHAFVEKPLSFSANECEEMADMARRNKVALTSGYIERFNPAVRETKKIIADRRYGDLLMMEFHRENRMPPHIKDVGIIYDTSVHDIDTAMYLFGSRPKVVFARSGRKFNPYEDFATIMLGFDDQKVAIIASNWITPKKTRTFSAVCTDGIIAGDFLTQEVRIDGGESTIIPRRQFQEPLLAELRSFVDFIDGRAEAPAVSAQDATSVTRVAEAAIRSCSTGQPVSLDL
ncbi:Gfo/Idh/MocA family protein [Nitrososphaera viennensis]|nr:Gfo/Idh/MocA family oxidoreductase [Nitrososphaera viennensis]UVS70150.1 Gfo/Idh/MocA family oxidoreductase [Nitrososphaera viennensis]